MILSKTPFRISFVGGGTDLPAFYRDEPGAVLSTSINKYMYISVNKKFDGNIKVSYSRVESVASVKEVQHPLVREALQYSGIQGGIEIASMADIPSSGTGLGSSSAYLVGLLNALYSYKKEPINNEKIASVACEIEINKCLEPIGKQDQYAVAYGGLNLIEFYPNEKVKVSPVLVERKLIMSLEEMMLVFFTGLSRSASEIISKQSKEANQPKNKILLRRMAQLAFLMRDELISGSIENIGLILSENWELKKQLNKNVSSPDIEYWYSLGMANGAIGGKILGAGGGGFLMFLAPIEMHENIIKALSNLRLIDVKFEFSGTSIILS
jgi:D-glycero-alpha-D-manno-heptose-7-phosphate kinase